MVNLRSSDNVVINVDDELLEEYPRLGYLRYDIVQPSFDDDNNPLPTIKGETLDLVVNYCKRQINQEDVGDILVNAHYSTIVDVMLAATDFCIEDLLKFVSQKFAGIVIGMHPDYLRDVILKDDTADSSPSSDASEGSEESDNNDE